MLNPKNFESLAQQLHNALPQPLKMSAMISKKSLNKSSKPNYLNLILSPVKNLMCNLKCCFVRVKSSMN